VNRILIIFIWCTIISALFGIGDLNNPYSFNEPLPTTISNDIFAYCKFQRNTLGACVILHNDTEYSYDSAINLASIFVMAHMTPSFVSNEFLLRISNIGSSPDKITVVDFTLIDTFSSSSAHSLLTLYKLRSSTTDNIIKQYLNLTNNVSKWKIPYELTRDSFGLERIARKAYYGVTQSKCDSINYAKESLYRFFTSKNKHGKVQWESFLAATVVHAAADTVDFVPAYDWGWNFDVTRHWIWSNEPDYDRDRELANGLCFIALAYDLMYSTFTPDERSIIENNMQQMNVIIYSYFFGDDNWSSFWHYGLSETSTNYKRPKSLYLQSTNYGTLLAGIGYLSLFSHYSLSNNSILGSVIERFEGIYKDYSFAKSGIFTGGLTYQTRALYLPGTFFTALNRKHAINLWSSDFMVKCMKATLARIDPDDKGHVLENDEWLENIESQWNNGGSNNLQVMRGLLPFYYQTDTDLNNQIGGYVNSLVSGGNYPQQIHASDTQSPVDFVLSFNDKPMTGTFTAPTSYSDEEMTILRDGVTNEHSSIYINHEHSLRCSHKHDEKTNYQFYYRGRPVIINSGYYKWDSRKVRDNYDSRDWISSSYAKNVVIADADTRNEREFINERFFAITDSANTKELLRKSPYSSNTSSYSLAQYDKVTPATKEMVLESCAGIKHLKVSTKYNNQNYSEFSSGDPESGNLAIVNRHFYQVQGEGTCFIFDEVINESGIGHRYSNQIHVNAICGSGSGVGSISKVDHFRYVLPQNGSEVFTISLGSNCSVVTDSTTVPTAWGGDSLKKHARIMTSLTPVGENYPSFLTTINTRENLANPFHVINGSNYFISWREVNNVVTVAGITKGIDDVRPKGPSGFSIDTDAKFFYLKYDTNYSRVLKLIINKGSYFRINNVDYFHCNIPTMEECIVNYNKLYNSITGAQVEYIVKKGVINPTYSLRINLQGITDTTNVVFIPYKYSHANDSENNELVLGDISGVIRTIENSNICISTESRERFITLKKYSTYNRNILSVYDTDLAQCLAKGTSPAGVPFTQMVCGNLDGGDDDEIALLYFYDGTYRYQIYNPGATDTDLYLYGYGNPVYSRLQRVITSMTSPGVLMKTGHNGNELNDVLIFYCPGTIDIQDYLSVYNAYGLVAIMPIGSNGGVPYTHLVVGDFDGDCNDEVLLYRNYYGSGSQTSTYLFQIEDIYSQTGGVHIAPSKGPATTRSGSIILDNILLDTIQADADSPVEIVLHARRVTTTNIRTTYDYIYQISSQNGFDIDENLSGPNNVGWDNPFTSIATGDFDRDGNDEIALHLSTSPEDQHGLISIFRPYSSYTGSSPGYQHKHIEPGQDIIAAFNATLLGESIRGDISGDHVHSALTLEQNYPNPFTTSTTVRFDLPTEAPTKLRIYNIRGQLVREIINEVKAQGKYQIVWDGNDTEGRRVSSGVYIYSLQSDGQQITKRLVVLK